MSSRVAPSITFLVGCQGELSSAVMTFEPLFTVVDATILDRLRRHTNRAGRHDPKPLARNSTSRSLHLEHYPNFCCIAKKAAKAYPDRRLDNALYVQRLH